ncbi:neural cell adhesion molecule 1-A isoform X4 [Salmo salar]|uniref:Neural cell adhesion molecule 1-A isoform X4 n=1 Tax=Salmo salar TaxID=8030 RepID=A0A1S3N7X8_SALSA|nr:neural cell adhesion molecule 1-A isoform X4 [Salmo salar]|eukprot:XP_014011400.1 PREDICTED: neural cell adhesion molecule 1-A isoform X3 [Salmo salar]
MAESMLILRMCSIMLVLGFSEAKMEIITSKPDVLLGENVMLLCKAGGEGDITWQKDGEDAEDYQVEKVDETSSKLFIRNAKMEDAGQYKCLCEFESGHRDDKLYTIFVYERPSFGETPAYHEFLEGQDGLITCMVTGKPAVEVNWERDHEKLHSEAGRIRRLKDNSLQINNITRKDHGTYTCEAKIKDRPIFEKLNISISVNVPPTAKLHEEVKKATAGPETNVSLSCLVEGVPQPKINWTVPDSSDKSRYKYNSDKSELIISSVVRSDHGEYICTAKNKISESSAMIMLDVSEHPEAVLSQEKMEVEPGQSISVSCNVSGHPMPALQWVRKTNNDHLLTVDAGGGRVRMEDGYVLVIDNVTPSDGGLYSCMAISPAGNASTDFSLQTWPGKASQVSGTPGPTSVHFTLGASLVDGGSPITHFTLQWKTGRENNWQEKVIQSTDPLVITDLNPYTTYSVRFAPKTHLGQGGFSEELTVRTQGIRGEPDSPVLVASEGKVEGNMFSIPLMQLDNGDSPIIHYTVRYRLNKVDEDWREKDLPSNSTVINLHDLQYKSDYHMEVLAVNSYGSSSSAKLNFSVPQPVAKMNKGGMGKGAVAGIVIVIFLVLLIAVDATCCYTNHCGMLMFLAVKLFGQKVPGMKTVEEGDGTSNGKTSPNGDPATEA